MPDRIVISRLIGVGRVEVMRLELLLDAEQCKRFAIEADPVSRS